MAKVTQLDAFRESKKGSFIQQYHDLWWSMFVNIWMPWIK